MKLLPKGRLARLSVFCFTFVALSALHAQTVTPEDEYKKLIRVSEDIQPLGEHPFGESISLYDGSLSFQQTDVSASGTGPLLQLTRQFQIEGSAARLARGEYAFGDWTLALPHIETLTANGYVNALPITGWQVEVAPGVDRNARCSHFNRPYEVVMHPSDGALTSWKRATWWKGYHMVIPGEGSQDLLANSDSASKGAYPIVTKNHWRISCELTSTANGQPGEGFLAHAPDGTRYWFNELVYRRANSLSRPLYSGPAVGANGNPARSLLGLPKDPIGDLIAMLSGSGLAHAVPSTDVLTRQAALMLVTRIEDRFGNSLTFDYDDAGQLTGISASDGRTLAINYDSGTPRIHSVVLQPAAGAAARTWVYSYTADGSSLLAVTLPDNSQWHFDLASFDTGTLSSGNNHSSCIAVGEPTSLASATGTITHPSGLVGTFTVKPVKRGRSYVLSGCNGTENNDPDTEGSYAQVPNAWYGYSIISRTLSGAGMPSQTWSYDYSEANESWYDCGSGCETTVYTDVVSPDNSTTRSTFSNRYDYTEGQLLQTDHYAGAAKASTLLRSELSHYAAPDTAPLPARAGYVQQDNVNNAQITQYSPLDRRQIVQGGDAYTWQAEAFNSYVQVTRTKRSNNIAGQTALEEQTDYLNDVTHWVLGLPTKVTNLTTGEVVDQNDYETTHDTLTTRWHFGQKLMSYAFDTHGNLASFTDGNTHTTTLTSYKRGIPQSIGYPDGTHQTLSVDDLGQISSITDQAGSTTGYSYDNVGRLTRITYPTGGERSWYAKSFNYAFVSGAERGVAANHWRRTVTTGNARQVTYFNAMLQPVLSDSYIYGDASSHTNVRNDYDFRGQTTFTSYPEDGTPNLGDLTVGTISRYDGLGRLTKSEQMVDGSLLITQTAYLSSARRQVTDPKNKTTTTTYQVFDQPSYDAVIKVQAPEGLTQTIARDLYGNPLSITQGGSYDTGTVSVTKALVYDAYHRLCRTAEPESGSEVMAYDAANNLAWSAAGQNIPTGTACTQSRALVPSAARTTRTYDAMNRVLSVAYPAGTQGSAFTYDALGRVHTATSGTATWTYDYNRRGMLTAETLDIDGHHWPFGYAHDAYGTVTLVTYPDGKKVGYAPDPLGRASKVGAYASGLSYYPDGQLEYYRAGNGTEYLATENGRHLLANLTYAASTAPTGFKVNQDFTYDANGNLSAAVDWVNHQRDRSYGYDGLNRLTSAQAPNLWGTETYRYDPLNNLRSLVTDGAEHSYQYDASNLLRTITVGGAGLHSFVYDNQGNTIQKDSTSLVFDKANRLNQVVGRESYTYDASGRRVKKVGAGGSTSYYAYGSGGKLLFQLDAATNFTTDYVYLGSKLLAEVKRGVGDTVLNPPSSISFNTNPNDGSYAVGWSPVGGASYELQESANGGASWSAAYSGAALSKAYTGKAAGGYLYRVRACQGECSDWTVSATLGVWPALATVAVPTGVQKASYSVSWNRPATAATFDVDEQRDSGTWQRIGTALTGTSISRPGSINGTYAYRVSARNAYGSRGWAISSGVTVLLPPDTAPASLSVPAISSTGGYTVSWGSVLNADSYTLQEQKDGGSWVTVYSGATLSKAFSGKTNGAHYGYQARGCNISGCGPFSAVHTVAIAIPPPAPTGVYANDLWANPKLETMTVVWQASAGATYYEVKNADTGSVLNTTTSTSLEVGSAYNEAPLPRSYAVRACNPYACSGWVSAQYRQVYNPPASAPSLSVPTTSTGSYTVSWGTVYQAGTYTLQEQKNGGSWVTAYSGTSRSKAYSGKATATYGYRARACNSGGCGPWSTTHTVKVAPSMMVTGLTAKVAWLAESMSLRASTSPSAPMAAGGDSIAPDGGARATMLPPPPEPTYAWFVWASWQAATGVTHYEVKVTNTVVGTVTSYTVTTLYLPSTKVNRSAISVMARACSSTSCSAWSAPVTAVRQ